MKSQGKLSILAATAILVTTALAAGAAPAGKESNWIQTIPGKAFWLLFRLYGPLEPWFDKTWRPGKIKVVK